MRVCFYSLFTLAALILFAGCLAIWYLPPLARTQPSNEKPVAVESRQNLRILEPALATSAEQQEFDSENDATPDSQAEGVAYAFDVQIEAPDARELMDTPFYVFRCTTYHPELNESEKYGVCRFTQRFGQFDKLALEENVTANYGDLLASFKAILQAKADRVTFLQSKGWNLPFAIGTWQTFIFKVAVRNGEPVAFVDAVWGMADPSTGRLMPYHLYESWKLNPTNQANPKLLKRAETEAEFGGEFDTPY